MAQIEATVIKIICVAKNSISEKAGIRTDDILISLNAHVINDRLDYYFYQSEEVIEILFSRNDRKRQVQIEKSCDEDLGLELEDFHLKVCSNNCIFCFIKQNPPGMRRQIYICDEDYRFSFLFGNYITLTGISDSELQRIAEQRLSPLYISVHATDSQVRKSIFRYKSDDRLMDKISFLVKNRITLHTQVVLVPGINDGDVLQQTIDDLYSFRKMIKTLAIVPVGLTRHRRRLPQIEPVSPVLAAALVRQSSKWNRRYRNSEDDPFVYLADEFYLLAGEPFPADQEYGPYYQLENGVGLCRQFINSLEESGGISVARSRNICLVTGKLAEPLLRNVALPYLNGIPNLNADVISIDNHFFGPTVTVSGLLTGADIAKQFPKNSEYDCIFLPPNCINQDGLMLDDMSVAELSHTLNVPVKIGDYDIKRVVNQIEA